MTSAHPEGCFEAMSIKQIAQVLSFAAGLAVVFPAAASPAQSPSCDGDKHGDEEKKKDKNPSAVPACGEGKDGKGKKDEDKSRAPVGLTIESNR